MKMQRYFAKDMRQALAKIRAEQGPDAVILSSHRTADGVQVCAAVDFEFSAQPDLAPVVASIPLPTPAIATLAATAPALTVAPPPPAAAPKLEPLPAIEQTASDRAGVEVTPAAAMPSRTVSEEICSLRHLLETQVAALAWNDFTRRHPLQARVFEELANIGLARDIALAIVNQLPELIDPEQASRMPLTLLTRGVLTEASPALEHGGTLALVGPNGAGKTTTLAKLATRWVLERGPREIALVTTDRDRFGSHEQLQALGRLLGVPTYVTEHPSSLGRLLERLSDRRLVLVDTPGIRPRSPHLAAELAGVSELNGMVEVALVVPASAQAGLIDECFAGFAAVNPRHCVLTKLDEATSLGGVISALTRSGLPVSWLSQGTRVPEDLEAARAHVLVARAVNLARKSGATVDEDLLARRFGGIINAAA